MIFFNTILVGSLLSCLAGFIFTLLLPEFSVFISKAVGVSILAHIAVGFLYDEKSDDRQDWR